MPTVSRHEFPQYFMQAQEGKLLLGPVQGPEILISLPPGLPQLVSFETTAKEDRVPNERSGMMERVPSDFVTITLRFQVSRHQICLLT